MSSGFSDFTAGASGPVSNSTLPRNRRSRQRQSRGRNSVASAGGTTRSFQNVTEKLQVNNISKEISDTDNSINALKQEIDQVQKRRESRSAFTLGRNKDNIGENNNNLDDLDLDPEKNYYSRHSRPRTFRPYFTLSFAFLCFVMFLISIGVNGGQVEDFEINPLIGPSVETLIKLGAKETDLLQNGEVFRLFLPMILHVGLIHLVVNLLGLFAIVLPMEQEFGSPRIAAISILSGISGVILSALLSPNTVGVGASGVVFGLLGAAWSDLLMNWHIYFGKNWGMLIQLSVVTVLNFLFGLMPFVDNFAHLGGFILGVSLGTVLLIKHYGDVKPRRSIQVLFRVTSVLVLPVLIAVLTFLLFLRIDIATNCAVCSFLSCVPFPPGASEDDRWWDCSPCFNGFGSIANFSEFEANIICPFNDGDNEDEDDVISIDPQGRTEKEFEKDFAFICSLACE